METRRGISAMLSRVPSGGQSEQENAGGSAGGGVFNISSLRFKANTQYQDFSATFQLSMKDIGTGEKYRAEILSPSQIAGTVQIVNIKTQQVYVYIPLLGTWTAYPITATEVQSYVSDAENYEAQVDDIVALFESGGGTITVGGVTISINDIEINPELSDSLFQPA